MKRSKRPLTACLALALCLLPAAGCASSPASRPANEITLPLSGVSEVTISYDEETVTFYEGETDELIVKEYMTENRPDYHARVTQRGGSIQISEGGKPLFGGGFSRSIEVYLPASYCETLTVTTTDGDIDLSSAALSLDSLRIDSTSGAVRLHRAEARAIHLSTTSGTLTLDALRADTIRLETTSGSVVCGDLEGAVTYTTTSGNGDIQSARGCGDYSNSNSGTLNVAYTEVTGDLTFYNKNGDVTIALPASLEFDFSAATKNGSITTSFPEYIATDGKTAAGAVGSQPTVTVSAETKNGAIEVRQSPEA